MNEELNYDPATGWAKQLFLDVFVNINSTDLSIDNSNPPLMLPMLSLCRA